MKSGSTFLFTTQLKLYVKWEWSVMPRANQWVSYLHRELSKAWIWMPCSRNLVHSCTEQISTVKFWSNSLDFICVFKVKKSDRLIKIGWPRFIECMTAPICDGIWSNSQKQRGKREKSKSKTKAWEDVIFYVTCTTSYLE